MTAASSSRERRPRSARTSSSTTSTSAGCSAMSEPILRVEGLNAFYGRAHVLHDVSFELGDASVAIVGRNGMGKTTLCAAIMGFAPPRVSGSIRFKGHELVGRASYR